MQSNIICNTNNFHFRGQLSRSPRTHRITNNQEMITFPIQNLDNSKWFRIAVYDKKIIVDVKQLNSFDIIEVSGITKKDVWKNKSGQICCSNVFIATSVILLK